MPAPWAAVARIKVKGTVQGQDYNNVIHFGTNLVLNGTPEVNAALQALCAAMIVCLIENLLPAVTSDFTLLSVEGTQLHPVLSDPIEVAADAGSVGTGGPASVSFIATQVNIRTGSGGRKGRGRIFLPPASEANTLNGEITAASQNEFGDFINCVIGKFLGQAGSENWEIGVLSKKDLIGNPNNYDVAFRPATSLILKPLCAKMGSRKRGSGN